MTPNELLFVLSARGQGSWYQFRSLVGDYVDDDGTEQQTGLKTHQRIKWSLSRHAHVEFASDRDAADAWRVAPPVLAVTPFGVAFRATLCGARSPELLARLGSAVSAEGQVTLQRVPVKDCADWIGFLADNEGALHRISIAAGIPLQMNAPLALLCALDPISRTSLGPPILMPFGKDIKKERFVVEGRKCRWELLAPMTQSSVTDGLYRLSRWGQSEHYLCHGGIAVRVGGQMGKYIILESYRRSVVRYNVHSRILRVPAICRPPLLVDRALGLCTGLPPVERFGSIGKGSGKVPFLEYAEVSPGVAGVAAHVLGQTLS